MNLKYFRITVNPNYTTSFTIDKNSIDVYTKLVVVVASENNRRRNLEEDYGNKKNVEIFKNRNGDYQVTLDVSTLAIGRYLLNVVPKPSDPPMLPKSAFFEVFDLTSTIKTAKDAKENAKTLNSAGNSSQNTVSVLTIVGTIVSSIFSYSAILKVGLTIKLL